MFKIIILFTFFLNLTKASKLFPKKITGKLVKKIYLFSVLFSIFSTTHVKGAPPRGLTPDIPDDLPIVILNIDGTLLFSKVIHSTEMNPENPDKTNTFYAPIHGESNRFIAVHKRPHLDEFLKYLFAQNVEIIIWSAAHIEYVRFIIKNINKGNRIKWYIGSDDKGKWISEKRNDKGEILQQVKIDNLSEQADLGDKCHERSSSPLYNFLSMEKIKDLCLLLGSATKVAHRTVLLEDTVDSCLFHPDNAIVIPAFKKEKDADDITLTSVESLLKNLIDTFHKKTEKTDFRDVLHVRNTVVTEHAKKLFENRIENYTELAKIIDPLLQTQEDHKSVSSTTHVKEAPLSGLTPTIPDDLPIVILDIDGTLLFSEGIDPTKKDPHETNTFYTSDAETKEIFGETNCVIAFHKRPHLDEFLESLFTQNVEIIIWSAARIEYVRFIIKNIDKGNRIKWYIGSDEKGKWISEMRNDKGETLQQIKIDNLSEQADLGDKSLKRPSCPLHNFLSMERIKDLCLLLGSATKVAHRTVLLEDTINSCLFHPDNAIVVPPFKNEKDVSDPTLSNAKKDLEDLIKEFHRNKKEIDFRAKLHERNIDITEHAEKLLEGHIKCYTELAKIIKPLLQAKEDHKTQRTSPPE